MKPIPIDDTPWYKKITVAQVVRPVPFDKCVFLLQAFLWDTSECTGLFRCTGLDAQGLFVFSHSALKP